MSCIGDSNCIAWKEELKVPENDIGCIRQDGKYYADREQVEAMIRWCEEKAKASAKPVPEFQVGDAISIVQTYRGEVVHIHDEKHSNTPITVKLKDGYVRHLSLKGEINDGCGRKLFHGHDLEITVKENLPVRPKKTREVWVVLWFDADTGVYSRVSDGSQGKDEAQRAYDVYKSQGKDPVMTMVEVPE